MDKHRQDIESTVSTPGASATVRGRGIYVVTIATLLGFLAVIYLYAQQPDQEGHSAFLIVAGSLGAIFGSLCYAIARRHIEEGD